MTLEYIYLPELDYRSLGSELAFGMSIDKEDGKPHDVCWSTTTSSFWYTIHDEEIDDKASSKVDFEDVGFLQIIETNSEVVKVMIDELSNNNINLDVVHTSKGEVSRNALTDPLSTLATFSPSYIVRLRDRQGLCIDFQV